MYVKGQDVGYPWISGIAMDCVGVGRQRPCSPSDHQFFSNYSKHLTDSKNALLELRMLEENKETCQPSVCLRVLLSTAAGGGFPLDPQKTKHGMHRRFRLLVCPKKVLYIWGGSHVVLLRHAALQCVLRSKANKRADQQWFGLNCWAPQLISAAGYKDWWLGIFCGVVCKSKRGAGLLPLLLKRLYEYQQLEARSGLINCDSILTLIAVIGFADLQANVDV